MSRPPVKHVSMFKPEPVRVLMALFFMILAAFAGKGLLPLPEEPARVQFWDLTLTVTAFIIAMNVLVNRRRVFYLAVLLWLPLARWYVLDRLKELEMALIEPGFGEAYLVYGIYAVGLIMLTPWVWRLFPDFKPGEKPQPPLLFRNGIRY